MGKASSAKKVSRVARTGGGRTNRRSTGSWGFPMVIALVVVLGVLGVVFSRSSSRNAAAADQPTVNDHWHAAYGFDVCGSFLPDLPQPGQLIGLHTHGDGVIHIEPQDPVADTGKSANLGRFIGGYGGLKLTSTSFTVINKTWKNGDLCGDKPGKVVVKRNGTMVTGDPTKVRVPKNGWITIAFVPQGDAVPAPPNWKEKVDKANGGAGEHGATSTTLPGAAPTTAAVPSAPPTSSAPTLAPVTSAPTGTPTTTP
jgi:hypothetical protein